MSRLAARNDHRRLVYKRSCGHVGVMFAQTTIVGTKTYAVKELFLTLQGEGAQAGRLAVFLRFAGCNLWSGRAADRAGAACAFCDTDFVGTDGVGGARYGSAHSLAKAVRSCWDARAVLGLPASRELTSGAPGPRRPTPQAGPEDLHHRTCSIEPYVICTGGEPLLQLDAGLLSELKASGFEVGVETNGTVAAPAGIDWLCVSPKGRTPGHLGRDLAITQGDELKLVFPQAEPEAAPDNLRNLEFKHHFLQPLDVVGDPAATARNVQACVAACARDPQWRLSLQTHKLIGLA